MNACAITPRCARHSVSAARAASPKLLCLEPTVMFSYCWFLFTTHRSANVKSDLSPDFLQSNCQIREHDRRIVRTRALVTRGRLFIAGLFRAEIRGRFAFAARRSVAIFVRSRAADDNPLLPRLDLEETPAVMHR